MTFIAKGTNITFIDHCNFNPSMLIGIYGRLAMPQSMYLQNDSKHNYNVVARLRRSSLTLSECLNFSIQWRTYINVSAVYGEMFGLPLSSTDLFHLLSSTLDG